MDNKTYPGRRKFLHHTALVGGIMMLPTAILQACSGAGKKPKPTILIVSGWQDVNIGDIAHTPGLLNILQKHLPDCRLILWKTSHNEEVGRMLHSICTFWMKKGLPGSWMTMGWKKGNLYVPFPG